MALFVVLALLGFVASVVVHVSTFLPVPPLGMDRAWPLHIGIFLVFFPMIIAQQRQGRQDANASRREGTAFALAPRWTRTLLAVVFAYAMLNFAVGMVLTSFTGPGSVYQKDGRYVLARGDAVELEAAPADYVRQEARVTRMFSGHWMLFYLASAAGLIDARRRARAEAAARRAAFLPLAARGSRYLLHPSPRLGPATHAALMLLLSVALAGGCTAALVMVLISTNNNPHAGAWRHLSPVGVLLSIPVFFAVLRATSGRFARHVPARCPSCGGPAHSNGIPRTRRLDDLTYACRNCGSNSYANGSLVRE